MFIGNAKSLFKLPAKNTPSKGETGEMGLRAYFLLNVKNNTVQDDLRNGLLELETIPGVDYVEPVVGQYDIVLVVETADNVEEFIAKIKNFSWVDKVTTLKVVNLFDHRQTSSGEVK